MKAALAPHVIYPYGPLTDLLPYGDGMRVYAVEFSRGVVKVGRSKNLTQRFAAIVKDAATLGLAPERFLISPHYQNGGRVELAILAAIRKTHYTLNTPEDFPASSEWFTECSLETVLAHAQEWVEWETQYGYPIGMRREDIEAKRMAEEGSA